MNHLFNRLREGQIARRLAGGFSANLLGKVWLSLVQFISVPVLTLSWGADGFGIWLMLVTIPSYLSLSDVGLSAAAATDVTKAVAAGNFDQALRSFQTSRLFATVMTGSVAVLSVIGLLAWLGSFTPNTGPWDAAILSWGVIFTTLGTLFSLQMSTLQIIYQATNKYALGTALRDLNIPLQGFAVIAVASFGGGLAEATGVSAGISALMLIFYAIVLMRLEPWLKLNFAFANWTTLRRLLRPSLASFALAGANSIGLQAVVITIGWSLGPAAAAVFATARMISRTPLQFAGLLSRASLPELTMAIEVGNSALTARLMRLNIWAATLVMAPALLILLFLGPSFLLLLSGGTLNSDRTLFALLALAALLTAIWTTLAMKLLAQNRHGEYAWVVLGLNILVALVPLLAGSGLLTAAAMMMFTDAVVLILIVAKSRDVFK